LDLRKRKFLESSSEDEDWVEGSSEDDDDTEDDDEEDDNDSNSEDDSSDDEEIGARRKRKRKTQKPPASRVIVEVDALKETLEKNSRCVECGGHIVTELKTTCLATSILLACKDESCGYIFRSQAPAGAGLGNDDKRERTTDYAINVLFVLGFLSSGDGGSEAAKVLGMLGLPNDTTMEKRSYGIIEDRISRVIRETTDKILLENLIEEARLSMNASFDENDLKLWKNALTDKTIVVTRRPMLSVSYDMAWQQRNSGHVYASPSGHAFLVGKYSHKPLCLVIKSKLCNYCKSFAKKNPELDIPEHDCVKNHTGSSSSMEPQGCLEMVELLYLKWNCVVKKICCDDDASTRSLVRWSNADHMKNNNTTQVPKVPISKGKNKGKLQDRPDKGRLNGLVPEPLFVADPNHRRKVLTGELVQLADEVVAKKETMTKMDSTRIGKNFGYFIRALPRMEEDEYIDAARAVIEHHFDDHKYCGNWCPRRGMTPEQLNASERYYRNKNNESNAKLYNTLSDKLARFITLDRLQEVVHGMDSQVNESLNNTISWLAPKNKVYCASWSLTNRIGIAVGINSLGMVDYFGRLFKALGIIMTPNIKHFLEVREKSRKNRLQAIKTRDKKKLCNAKKHLALKEHTEIARKERARHDGTYKRGMNMSCVDGYTADDLDQRPKKKRNTNIQCKLCGRKGHSTARSKQCLHYNGGGPTNVPPVATAATTTAQQEDDDARDDTDNFDQFALAEDDDDDSDIFFDPEPWEGPNDDIDNAYDDVQVAYII
jgi:hypothetical protein